jgi:hypothetical protein
MSSTIPWSPTPTDSPGEAAGSDSPRPISGALAVALTVAMTIGGATFATIWAHSRLYQDWHLYEAVAFYGGVATAIAFAAVAVLAWRRAALVLAMLSAVLALDALVWVSGVTRAADVLSFLFLFGPLLVTGLVFAIVLWSRRRHASDPPRPVGRLFLGLGLGAILQIPIAAVSRMLYAHDLFAAKLHCEQVALALADYRERNGRYPDDLAFLGNPPRPRLLRGERSPSFYRREQDEFVLALPTGYWGHLEYRSASHEWSFDD